MLDVIIIGGGLAGLACGVKLSERGFNIQLLEATDAVGGRVKTSYVDGFTLDHGFQVLLTSYPACRDLLDYSALELRPFEPGALVWNGQKAIRMSDPWRQPWLALQTALAPIGTLADKWRLGKLRSSLRGLTLEEFWARPQETTQEHLQRLGFSDSLIETFWRPFLGGVMLDPDLQASSRFFEFVFQMFSTGHAAVPAGGMQKLAQQLADRLPAGVLQLQRTVLSLRPREVVCSDGQTLSARCIVLATDQVGANRLLGKPAAAAWRGTTCLYFAADQPPYRLPLLYLDGRRSGPVNHLAVMTNVAPEYAPPGQALISANVLGEAATPETLEQSVRIQLKGWFGNAVDQWRLLRTFHIPYALPSQHPHGLDPVVKPQHLGEDLWACGDYLETASLQGAVASGLRVAKELIKLSP